MLSKGACPRLVLVTGQPASGKTSLARRISSACGLPCLCKDDLKEILFEQLGAGDRTWSRQLGAAVYEQLYHLMEMELSAGRSLLVESNFDPAFATGRIRGLLERCQAECLEIILKCDPDVLLARFQARTASGERHPGHADALALAELRARLAAGDALSLDLPGDRIELDTSDFAQVDSAALIARIQQFLNRP